MAIRDDIPTIDGLLSEFQRACEEIVALERKLYAVQRKRDELRNRLRAMAGEADASAHADGTGPPSGAPLVISLADRGASIALREAAAVVRDLGGQADAEAVGEKLGITREAARLRLARAYGAGLLRRIAHGLYGIMPPDPEVADGTNETGVTG